MDELKNDKYGLGLDLEGVPVEVLGRLVAMRRGTDEATRRILERLRPLLQGSQAALEACLADEDELEVTLGMMVLAVVGGPGVDGEFNVSTYRAAFALLYGMLDRYPSSRELRTAERVVATLRGWPMFRVAACMNGADDLHGALLFVADYWDGEGDRRLSEMRVDVPIH